MRPCMQRWPSGYRLLWAVFVASAVIAVVVPACGNLQQIDGFCNVTDDCHAPLNLHPGTVCDERIGRCVCAVVGEIECCKKGSTGVLDCDVDCRRAEECACPFGICEEEWTGDGGTTDGATDGGGAGGGGGGSGGGGSGGEGGTAPEPECVTATDCLGAPDPRCGTAVCDNGACGLIFVAEPGEVVPLGSQIRGDCLTQYCDATGHSLVIEDSDDIYNDGKPCTINDCQDGVPIWAFVPDGEACPGIGAGFCFDGECVECVEQIVGAADCGPGNDCRDVYCTPDECIVSGDCGDACAPCATGYQCDEGDDCKSGVCDQNGMCALPTCDDATENGGETGTDCGGGVCQPCPDGEGCLAPSDCVSLVCWIGACQVPACDDGVKNGEESGVDCGGPCGLCHLP